VRAAFVVEVDLDSGYVETIARHRKRESLLQLRDLALLLEARLSDSIRHVDGVAGPVSISGSIDGTALERLEAPSIIEGER
jgi:hypothetical protein